jgi:anti-sigma factor RsiW
MTFDDETLMAYADGELDAAARAAVEAAIAADAALAQRVARHRELRERLHAAFDPVLSEPLPERLLASARGAPRTGDVMPLRARSAPRGSWPQWAAIAASLVIGVLSGALLPHPGAESGPIVARNGQMLASGVLASALSRQLASTQPPNAAVRIGVSFRTRDGVYCRTFVLEDAAALAGLACHERAAW